MNTSFQELILITLGKQDSFSRVPTEAEWSQVYAETENQALIGFCFSSIEKLSTEQRPTMNFLMDRLGQMSYMETCYEEHQRAIEELGDF